jgi:hypothetical protein
MVEPDPQPDEEPELTEAERQRQFEIVKSALSRAS